MAGVPKCKSCGVQSVQFDLVILHTNFSFLLCLKVASTLLVVVGGGGLNGSPQSQAECYTT